jgi:lipid-A-disaccharide synthase
VPSLLVSSGEPSGDLYAAELVRELRARCPDLRFFGLGGDRLQAQGARLLAHVRDMAVVGLVEVVRHLPRIHGVFRSVLAEVDRERPVGAVLVDYPDFNLRLAKALHERGIPVIYYISPQIWAWRGGRIREIARSVSRMLVIFPFEAELYEQARVPVTFVGHPLLDLVRKDPDPSGYLRSKGLDPERPVVALAPGSRPKEVAHNLPPLLRAVDEISRRKGDVQFLVVLAPSLNPSSVDLRGLKVVWNETYQALSASTLAIVASGTITVEAALLGTPMIVVYRLSPWTYALGRPFVKVPHFAMANLIAGRRIVPERIQGDFTPSRVAEDALALLDSEGRRQEMKKDLAEVRRLLGGGGASSRGAVAVLDALGMAQGSNP